MYKLSIVNDIKKMTIKKLKHFVYENYYRGTIFSIENNYYSIKHQEKKILSFAIKLIEKNT